MLFDDFCFVSAPLPMYFQFTPHRQTSNFWMHSSSLWSRFPIRTSFLCDLFSHSHFHFESVCVLVILGFCNRSAAKFSFSFFWHDCVHVLTALYYLWFPCLFTSLVLLLTVLVYNSMAWKFNSKFPKCVYTNLFDWFISFHCQVSVTGIRMVCIRSCWIRVGLMQPIWVTRFPITSVINHTIHIQCNRPRQHNRQSLHNHKPDLLASHRRPLHRRRAVQPPFCHPFHSIFHLPNS